MTAPLMQPRDPDREQLRQRVRDWSRRLRVEARGIRVQRMTRKWGSCSTNGIITLADDLADQDAGFQDFVIAHELLHLRLPNHSRVFKALMTAHVPGWRDQDMHRAVADIRSTPRDQKGSRESGQN